MFYRTNTYFGFYAALLEQAPIVIFFIGFLSVYMLFFISLCLYVNASVSGFKAFIDDLSKLCEMESLVERKKIAVLILKKVVILHSEMLKYDCILSIVNSFLLVYYL